MSANLRGSLWMVAAMVCFAVEDALFKLLTQQLSPGLGTVVFGLAGMTIFAAMARRSGERAFPPETLQPRLMVRTGFEIMGRLFFALALAFTPLSTSTAILQAAPLVVTFGAVLFLGERVGIWRWTAMAAGLIGVLMILKPAPGAFRADAILAVLGMIGFAGRDLATRMAPRGVSWRQLGVLGFAVVAMAGLLILASELVRGGAAPAIGLGPRELVILAGMGVIGVTGYSAITRAMQTGEISVVAPFRYSRLLVALVIATVIFGERPDVWTLLGGVVIVVSGVVTLMRSGGPKAAGPAV